MVERGRESHKSRFPVDNVRGTPFLVDVARKKGVPLSIISEGMGHTSEKTTRIYLKALNNSEIDRANKSIIYSV